MANRYCNKVNFFCDDGARDRAHAFQLRGKHILQTVPHRRHVGGTAGVRWFVGSIAVLAFLGFLGVQIIRAAAPPQLMINSPREGEQTSDPQVIVTGATEPETAVEINGQQVFSRPDGTFTEPVELQTGANKIFVRAIKKYGLFTTVSRTVMLKAPENNAPSVSVAPRAPSETSGSLN